MRAVLERLRLEQYAEAFDEAGFDDASFLATLGEEKLRRFGMGVLGMKVGHAEKLALKFEEAHAMVQEAAAVAAGGQTAGGSAEASKKQRLA